VRRERVGGDATLHPNQPARAPEREQQLARRARPAVTGAAVDATPFELDIAAQVTSAQARAPGAGATAQPHVHHIDVGAAERGIGAIHARYRNGMHRKRLHLLTP